MSSRKTDGDDEPTTTTAFRAAEKHYQLKREQVWKKKGGRLRGVGLAALPTDFSGVLDLELADVPSSSSCGSHQSSQRPSGPRGWGDALHPEDTLPTAASVSCVAESCGLEYHHHESSGCAPGGIFSFGRFPGPLRRPGGPIRAAARGPPAGVPDSNAGAPVPAPTTLSTWGRSLASGPQREAA